jgi:hypothetical protein
MAFGLVLPFSKLRFVSYETECPHRLQVRKLDRKLKSVKPSFWLAGRRVFQKVGADEFTVHNHAFLALHG